MLVAQICQLGIQSVDIGLNRRRLLYVGHKRGGIELPDLQGWVDLLPSFNHGTCLSEDVAGERFAGHGNLLL